REVNRQSPFSPGASQAPPGQFRFEGKQRPLRKSIAERFAALTRERRELKPIGLAMKFTPSHASLSSHFD
ncbi:hypothetical protein, partial [Mesotoga prima]|uniref:hypothetical protein n=1 Tax=Mesotoga prima TaxID=1184387 RepID=UPI002C4EFCFB